MERVGNTGNEAGIEDIASVSSVTTAPLIAISSSHEEIGKLDAPSSTSPTVAYPTSLMRLEEPEMDDDELAERATGPQPAVMEVAQTPSLADVPGRAETNNPETPLPPILEPSQDASPTAYASYTNKVEQALHRLSEAARRIAAFEEPGQNNARAPRASRLAPLRDISLDIRRDSTPLSPLSPLPQTLYSTQPEQPTAPQGSLPDFWPWLQDTEEDEEGEVDGWSNHTDPLQARSLPRSIEMPQIAEDDLRQSSGRLSVIGNGRQGKTAGDSRLRMAFICLTIMALLALTVDTVLASFTAIHPRPGKATAKILPSLTLSTNTIRYGQDITVYIQGFSSSSRVSLTRDIEEAVETHNGGSLIQTKPDGSARAVITIANSWDPGFHTIEAEDTTTRFTASATLRIDAGPTRPAHLRISTTTLDLGADIQGANTIQPLLLQNEGSGAITWSASSDQSWLSFSPTHGVFSDVQKIMVGGERTNLAPGDYSGTITFSSNVGTMQTVKVGMTVRPLPANAGAVLAVNPAVLSFTAIDGGADPSVQSLVINNPGSQPLYWSLGDNTTTAQSDQPAYFAEIDPNANWLNTDQSSGVVMPQATSSINVNVHSHALLPGVYNKSLVFNAGSGHSALNSPQNVSVALTIQPRCGLTLSTGSLAFNAVSGQTNPSDQAVSLMASASCPGTTTWSAVSSVNWLTITPASGQLKGTTNATVNASVSTAGLKPGSYNGNITIATGGQNTQSVAVQLTVQPPLPPSAPIIGAAPLNLNFSAVAGQPDPPGQVVTLTNTGGSPLSWHTSINLLASSWLGASPTGGTVAPGQTGQLQVNVSANGLTPGTYVGQVVLNGQDANNTTAGGSPQTIQVNFVVLPPCSLAQPTSSALAFNATQGDANPAPQSIVITAAGNCSWPLSWNARANSSASWLKFTPSSAALSNSGQSTTLSIAPDISGLRPGFYRTQVSITATDSANQPAQGSPQTFSVTLNVQSPCTLQVPTSSLAFSVAQGATSAAQSLAFSTSGNCANHVSWSAGSDASWLVLTAKSGNDIGSSSTVAVSVDGSKLLPGSYKGTVTLTAGDGTAIQGSPQTVPVTLTVTGFTVSGTVNTCADSSCASSQPLAGATVTLKTSTGSQLAVATTDATGNYSFNNIANGSYTLSASGSGANAQYTGTASATVAGGNQSVAINTTAPAPTPVPTPVPTPAPTPAGNSSPMP